MDTTHSVGRRQSVAQGQPGRVRAEFQRAAEELSAIAAGLDASLNVETRDVHTWIEARESDRARPANLRVSAMRRDEATRRLFNHSATPALAKWLIRYARPARLEVGLVEAHRAVGRMKAGDLPPEAAVARLVRLANRSWYKDRADCPELDVDDFPSPAEPTPDADSLVPEALELLRRAGIRLSEPAAQLIAEAVDQAVDFLADEADRTGGRGPDVFQALPARRVNRHRRASNRVVSHHPAGSILRYLVLGPDGLVARALAERLDTRTNGRSAWAGPLNVRSWAVGIARLEATIRDGSDTKEAGQPALGGPANVQNGSGVAAASA